MANGKLGSALLTATTHTLLYTVPEGKTATANVRIVNQNASSVRIRVAIGSGSSPAAADYTTYDHSLASNGIYEDTGFICGAGEKIWVYSDTAGVVVRVHGIEE